MQSTENNTQGKGDKMQVGDRVTYYVRRANTSLGRELLGKRGVILDSRVRPSDHCEVQYLVEFDEEISRGHNGSGRGASRRCLWISEQFLQIPVSVKKQKKGDNMFRKLGVIAQKTLDKDLRDLVRAGILNPDLTVRDVDAVVSLMVTQTEFKKELAGVARELLEEEEKETKKSK